MPRTSASPNREILEAALQGLETQRDKLEQQIAEVRSMMGGTGARRGRPAGSGSAAKKTASGPRKKRVLSAEARRRIAAAQKKRWANFRKAQQ